MKSQRQILEELWALERGKRAHTPQAMGDAAVLRWVLEQDPRPPHHKFFPEVGSRKAPDYGQDDAQEGDDDFGQ